MVTAAPFTAAELGAYLACHCADRLHSFRAASRSGIILARWREASHAGDVRIPRSVSGVLGGRCVHMSRCPPSMLDALHWVARMQDLLDANPRTNPKRPPTRDPRSLCDLQHRTLKRSLTQPPGLLNVPQETARAFHNLRGSMLLRTKC